MTHTHTHTHTHIHTHIHTHTGCAIDTNQYPANTLFRGRSKTEAFECVEMLCDKPWSAQVDLYNVTLKHTYIYIYIY